MQRCYRLRPDGIELAVRLTPRAARDAVEGVVVASDDSRRLAVRVRAVPEKGSANTALLRLLATHFGLPKQAVTLAAGATSRTKTVRLAGDPDALAALVDQI